MRHRNVGFVLVWFLACGEVARESTPEIAIVVLEHGQVRPLADLGENGPVAVILRLTGPDGTRIERIESRSGHGHARFNGLSPGRWSLGGDGLDQQGMVAWSARRVWFDVQAGKATSLQLVFERIE